MSNGSDVDLVEWPEARPLFSEVALLNRVERMMQREQDLPLSFFARDCHEDSEVPF